MMKKIMLILAVILLLLTALYPVGGIVAALLGYKLALVSITALAVIIALLSCSILSLGFKFKDSLQPLATRILLSITAPLSIANAFCCIYRCTTALVIVCSVISVGCAFFTAVKSPKSSVLKIISFLSSAFIVLSLIILGSIGSIFDYFSKNTVVRAVESPSGSYYAEVIEGDQGALGGNTFVQVREKGINLVIFSIAPKPQRVYTGDFGESDKLNIYWESDECLVIDSAEFWLK